MGMTIDTSLLYESGYNKGFKDGIKGSIPKDQYEARLKADIVAMLEEIQLEVHELWDDNADYIEGIHDSEMIIQEKINALNGTISN